MPPVDTWYYSGQLGFQGLPCSVCNMSLAHGCSGKEEENLKKNLKKKSKKIAYPYTVIIQKTEQFGLTMWYCVEKMQNSDLNYLRMNHSFEKIKLFNRANFR